MTNLPKKLIFYSSIHLLDPDPPGSGSATLIYSLQVKNYLDILCKSVELYI